MGWTMERFAPIGPAHHQIRHQRTCASKPGPCGSFTALMPTRITTLPYPPPTYPITWASWYRANDRQESNASWNYNSAYCPDGIYQIYRSFIEAAEEDD